MRGEGDEALRQADLPLAVLGDELIVALTLVEVMLPKMDIPDFLRAVTQALEERNSRV